MVVDLLKKADYDNEVIGTESKITSITALATTAAVNAVKNEIPNVSDAKKKTTEYDGKISDIEKNVCLTSCHHNKFTSKIFDAKIKENKLVKKSVISGLIDKKIETLATKAELEAEKYKVLKLQTTKLSYLLGKIFIWDDSLQIMFVYQLTFSILELKEDRDTD